ncbi:hypothetical protein [Tsukamurella pulmonis]|uniref:hypothetical protein n=1 Tax=Tsukamurella pulmonis TaxID=47312 RepID=UPI000A49C3E0|nr:hypothetical protein [Tsukamurella pulmonis]
MRLTRTVVTAAAGCAAVAGTVTAPVQADIGPICNSNPTGVEARAGNALQSHPAQMPTIVPGRMLVTAVPHPWKDTDWYGEVSWRNVDTDQRGSSVNNPLSTGRIVFDDVPTGPGTIAYTVRTYRAGIDAPMLECHDVVRIS